MLKKFTLWTYVILSHCSSSGFFSTGNNNTSVTMGGSRKFCQGSPDNVFFSVINVFQRGLYGHPSRSDWTLCVQSLLKGGQYEELLKKPVATCDFPRGVSRPPAPPPPLLSGSGLTCISSNTPAGGYCEHTDIHHELLLITKNVFDCKILIVESNYNPMQPPPPCLMKLYMKVDQNWLTERKTRTDDEPLAYLYLT